MQRKSLNNYVLMANATGRATNVRWKEIRQQSHIAKTLIERLREIRTKGIGYWMKCYSTGLIKRLKQKITEIKRKISSLSFELKAYSESYSRYQLKAHSA